MDVQQNEQVKETETNQEAEQKLATPQQVFDYLVEMFPNCFSKEGDAKPLKIGIFQDLAERLADDTKVSKTQLRGVLRHYTSSWRYLRSVQVGAFRVDLDGNQGDVLEQEHVDHAKQQLEESMQKADAKRKAQNKDKKPRRPVTKNNKKNNVNNSNKSANKAKLNKKVDKKDTRPLAQASLEQLSVNAKVQVKLGNNPVSGTVTEIAKDGIFVQLTTGMVIKAQLDNIFIPS